MRSIKQIHLKLLIIFTVSFILIHVDTQAMAQEIKITQTKKEKRAIKKEERQARKEKKKETKALNTYYKHKKDSITRIAKTLFGGEANTDTIDSLKQTIEAVRQQAADKQDGLDEYLRKYRDNKMNLKWDSLNGALSKGKGVLEKEAQENKQIAEVIEKANPYLNEAKELTQVYQNKKTDTTNAVIKEYAKTTVLENAKENEDVAALADESSPYLKEVGKIKEQYSLSKKDTSNTALKEYAKKAVLAQADEYEQTRAIKQELTPYINSPYLKGVKLSDLDSLSADSLKSLAKSTFASMEKRLEQEILKRKEIKDLELKTKEIEALKNLPDAYRKQFEKYKSMDKDQLKAEGKAEATKIASDYLSKHKDKLGPMQKQLTKLKKKYSYVHSSGDLSTAKKRSSLEGRPFKERIVLGGNFQIPYTEPLNIDISPVLGFKFNKNFHIAMGGTFRVNFENFNQLKSLQTKREVYGYRAFGEHVFWKGFYVHGEYERMSKEFKMVTTDEYQRKWVEGLLVGIGKSYKIKGIITGNSMILYNTFHDENTPVYPSPWIFRFGIDLNLGGVKSKNKKV